MWDDEMLGEQADYEEAWLEQCPAHGWQPVEEAVMRPVVVLTCGCEVESERA